MKQSELAAQVPDWPADRMKQSELAAQLTRAATSQISAYGRRAAQRPPLRGRTPATEWIGRLQPGGSDAYSPGRLQAAERLQVTRAAAGHQGGCRSPGRLQVTRAAAGHQAGGRPATGRAGRRGNRKLT